MEDESTFIHNERQRSVEYKLLDNNSLNEECNLASYKEPFYFVFEINDDLSDSFPALPTLAAEFVESKGVSLVSTDEQINAALSRLKSS